MTLEEDERFYIGASSIAGAGDGLFTREPLAAGERYEVFGVLIAQGSIQDRCTSYADRYKFRMGSRLLIPLGYGAMINHSDDPNLEKLIEGDRLFLTPLRPIQRGEELFFRYSDYAKTRFLIEHPRSDRS